LQWLRRGKSLDDEWTMHPIPCDEPTVHRVRAIDIDGDGKPEVVSVPLQGRGCTAKGNWTDGRPVRITAYKVPANPEKPESWKPVVLSEEFHVVHNFWPLTGSMQRPMPGLSGRVPLLIASYEGVHVTSLKGAPTPSTRVHQGNQANPKGNRGASEIKSTQLKG